MTSYEKIVTRWIVCGLICSLSACSLFSSEPVARRKDASAAGPAARVPVQQLDSEKADNLEIVWQASDEGVKTFVIRYGMNPETLTEEIRVDAAQVERYEDPEYGPVFRHVLKNLPTGRSIFVSIASINEFGTSVPSSVFEVQAEKGR